VINDGNQAAEVIRRVRAFAKRTDAPKMPPPIKGFVDEAIQLLRCECSAIGHYSSWCLRLSCRWCSSIKSSRSK
jgi:hypothetical protein